MTATVPSPASQRRATVKDVARRAGVSVGTASLALNKPAMVSEAARQAVLKAAGELGYRPNLLAQSLVAQRRPTEGAPDPGGPRLVAVGYVSIDFVVAVDPFPAPGQRVTSRFIDKMIGGPAANVAAFAAALGGPLGLRTEIITRLGDDADSLWAIEELARRKVDASGAQAVPGERLSRCIVLVDGSGERTIVNEPLQVPLELVVQHLLERPRVPGRSCIHFDGFHLATAERAADRLREHGHLLSLHAAGLEPSSQTLERATAWLETFDLLFLDRATMARIAASDPKGELERHPERIFRHVEAPRCQGVLLTREAEGATLLRPHDPPLSVPAPVVEVVDATGAGDAFTGIFLGSFLAAGDPVRALEHAVRGASLSLTAYGAQGRLVRAEDLVAAPAGSEAVTPRDG